MHGSCEQLFSGGNSCLLTFRRHKTNLVFTQHHPKQKENPEWAGPRHLGCIRCVDIVRCWHPKESVTLELRPFIMRSDSELLIFIFRSEKKMGLLLYSMQSDFAKHARTIFCVKLSINNHIVGLVHKNHIIRTRLMYHAACKVEFQPFKRLYSQLMFFNFFKIRRDKI